ILFPERVLTGITGTNQGLAQPCDEPFRTWQSKLVKWPDQSTMTSLSILVATTELSSVHTTHRDSCWWDSNLLRIWSPRLKKVLAGSFTTSSMRGPTHINSAKQRPRS